MEGSSQGQAVSAQPLVCETSARHLGLIRSSRTVFWVKLKPLPPRTLSLFGKFQKNRPHCSFLSPKSEALQFNPLQDPCQEFDSLNSFRKIILFTTKAAHCSRALSFSTSLPGVPQPRLPVGVPPHSKVEHWPSPPSGHLLRCSFPLVPRACQFLAESSG